MGFDRYDRFADTTVQLLCEGSCNPDIKHVDAALLRELRPVANGTVLASEAWIRRQRQLRYTPHRMTALNKAVCAECETVRKFGDEIGW